MTLEQVQAADDPTALLLPVDGCFAHLPALALTAAQEKRVRNGTAFTYAGRPGQYRAYGAGGEFLALVQTDGEKLTTVKSFFDV